MTRDSTRCSSTFSNTVRQVRAEEYLRRGAVHRHEGLVGAERGVLPACRLGIRKAAKYGIVVLLAPVYLGYPGAGEGFYDEVLANGPQRMLQYGEFLGRRYQAFDNIIWVMGGDRNPGQAREDVDLVAYGIRELDRRHLFTAHCRAEFPPAEEYPGSWLNIGNTYSGSIVHNFLIEDYNRSPTKPNFLIESSYEGEQLLGGADSPPSVLDGLSGAFGQVFGNRPIWLFDPGWQAALDSTGSSDMMRWGRLFRSQRWFDLVPDQKHQVVTGGSGSSTAWTISPRRARLTAPWSWPICRVPARSQST